MIEPTNKKSYMIVLDRNSETDGFDFDFEKSGHTTTEHHPLSLGAERLNAQQKLAGSGRLFCLKVFLTQE